MARARQKADLASDRIKTMTLRRIRRGDGEKDVQLRKRRADNWTAGKRFVFLETLKATCNVSEAARTARKSTSSAYDLRQRDPGFAAEWREALEQGYAELEMMLLRQSIFGSTTTETVDDGRGEGPHRVKTVHSYPLAVALRLMLAHKASVDAFRNSENEEQPGSDALREEILNRIDQVRRRLREARRENENDESGGN